VSSYTIKSLPGPFGSRTATNRTNEQADLAPHSINLANHRGRPACRNHRACETNVGIKPARPKVDAFICAASGTEWRHALARGEVVEPRGVKNRSGRPGRRDARFGSDNTGNAVRVWRQSIYTKGYWAGPRSPTPSEGFHPDYSYRIPMREALPYIFLISLAHGGACLGVHSSVIQTSAGAFCACGRRESGAAWAYLSSQPRGSEMHFARLRRFSVAYSPNSDILPFSCRITGLPVPRMAGAGPRSHARAFTADRFSGKRG